VENNAELELKGGRTFSDLGEVIINILREGMLFIFQKLLQMHGFLIMGPVRLHARIL